MLWLLLGLGISYIIYECIFTSKITVTRFRLGGGVFLYTRTLKKGENLMKKTLALFLVTGLLLTSTACSKVTSSSASSSTSANTAYTVTDSRGKVITFDKAPEKIISLLPSDTEIIYALGDGDKLIAVDTYSNYPAAATKKKQMGSGDKTSIESIIGMKPDLVILGQMAQTQDQFNQLENAGIKVVVTQAGNIADTYKVIEMVGKIVKEDAKATKIVDGMKSDFEKIKNDVKGKTPRKVYIEISPLQYKLWSCGKGTFQDELLTLVGAKNIFSDISSWQQVSEEQVIARNPQVIITTVASTSGAVSSVTEIKSRANWSKIDAVKNGKVYMADSDEIQRPGPRLADAAKKLEMLIYG